MATEHPNLIFIMADTVSSQALGCYGSPFIKTPNIDALAERCTVFEKHYQPATMCMPSRVSMLTGRLPANTHVFTNSDVYDRRYPSILKYLKDAGYCGAFLGLFHAWQGREREGLEYFEWIDFDGDVPRGNLTDEAFNEQHVQHYREVLDAFPPRRTDKLGEFHHDAGYSNDPLEKHLAVRLTEYAKDCIDRFKPDRANALFISHWIPHEPWVTPKKYWDMYPLEDVVLPGNVHDDRRTRPEHHNTLRNVTSFEALEGSDENLKRIWRAYAGNMTLVDDCVGDLISHLKAKDLFDDALICFATDHGTTHGAHGWLYKGGSFMIDEISRVPFLVKAPGQSTSHRVKDLTNTVDFVPTALELLGLPAQESDGRSLVPHLDGTPIKNARAYGQHGSGHNGPAESVRMLRRGKWKYNLYNAPGVEELYNLEDDPLELQNIASSERSVVGELREELIAFLNSTQDAFLCGLKP